MKITCEGINFLPEVATVLIQNLKEKIVLFYGEMGVGKTTLISEICKQLNVQDEMSSPTFSIVNEYFSDKLQEPIYHFDFYRINSEEEAMDFGYEDYFYSGNYCFIEWPEKIPNLLPEKVVKVFIAENKKTRVITIN